MAINNETNQIYNDDSNEEDNDEYCKFIYV